MLANESSSDTDSDSDTESMMEAFRQYAPPNASDGFLPQSSPLSQSSDKAKRSGSSSKPARPASVGKPTTFEAEAILEERPKADGSKMADGKPIMEYLIKWLGYADSDNTWEPVENIHSPSLFTAFRARQLLAKADAARAAARAARGGGDSPLSALSSTSSASSSS